jgi:hypothetical protein
MHGATCRHRSSTSPAARHVNDAPAEARGYRLSLCRPAARRQARGGPNAAIGRSD